MARFITLSENPLSLVLEITDEGDVHLLHCSALPFREERVPEKDRSLYRLVELQATGEDRDGHHSSRYTYTVPGKRLHYSEDRSYQTDFGTKWEIEQVDATTGLHVISHLQLFSGLSCLRSWTEVRNDGPVPQTIEYISSFAYYGFAKEGEQNWDQRMQCSVPYSTCLGEGQWRSYTLPEIGLSRVGPYSGRRFAITSVGTWSSGQTLPVAYLQNNESNEGWLWQIEHNGSWHWEMSDIALDQLYVQISGPTDQEHQWFQPLAPGETFTSIPVALCAVEQGFEQAVAQMTQYRRRIRRPNRDNEQLPVIFNDYMNCLWANPSEEKLLPLIDAAAEVGSDYFCIDAGWFNDGYWWDSVGIWTPAETRFTHGLQSVLEYIRQHGMVPGLWLEIEVMGIHCSLAQEWPDECFFCRHGKRVIDHGRYQLDFRHPLVLAHANEAIDRLVQEYGVGYLKIDYNINIGVGTDVDAASPGVGLLAHNRAYLNWLDQVFVRYPHLVIENCGSGGMRMDYALLSRHSLQSTSDQDNYRLYAPIAASCLSAVTPEQSAIWTYPLEKDETEGVIFNMVNALLQRIHLSGQLAQLPPAHVALVKEAIQLYKEELRREIPHGLPFWPLGLPTFDASWVSLGLHCGQKDYVAVWRRDTGEASIDLPLHHRKGIPSEHIQCIYPSQGPDTWNWQEDKGVFTVTLPTRYSARLFRIG
ncbi:glycoside hydrolase family 36 protein [Tengunoibacter tsumagoiensis]|uniref:Alpha-galactosidase n=1 Tax=Tengunoibacter tsumagoiensis TaxID=2014871 RepID=A0A402A857_9CHLR|nr:glycoside hydrolase family 36 protein [Tengunoibacter tsumagoiensis]GCE15278.1 hypothetical protein KTT_51370 [Tengunoibacter tsumagoiensis]